MKEIKPRESTPFSSVKKLTNKGSSPIYIAVEKLRDFRELGEENESIDSIRLFAELLLLLHSDLEEIKEVLKSYSKFPKETS